MKKLICIMLSVCLLMSFSAVAWADTTGTDFFGYYVVGTPAENVTITLYSDTTGTTAVNSPTVINVGTTNAEKFVNAYEGAIRMKVDVTLEKDGQYLVLLATGDDLPTADSAIYYIDQKASSNKTVSFNVYPKEAPSNQATAMTLFITSPELDENIKIGMGYAPAGIDYPIQQYVLGDVNRDGKFNSDDATMVLKIAVGLLQDIDAYTWNAADVNRSGKINSTDATLILKYAVGLIQEFPIGTDE